MEHRAKAVQLLEAQGRKHEMTRLQIEGARFEVEVAKVHALLAIEERLGYIQNQIRRLDKEV